MPNMTIFLATEDMPSDIALSELTAKLTRLCTNTLKATLGNVHIIYVAARPGRGHRIFVEVKYRLEPFRTKAVMDAFLEELDETIKTSTGLTARIRCFGYAEQNIHARN